MLTRHIRNYPNLERSAFRRGAYVGYAAGQVWVVCKSGKGWQAVADGRAIYSDTLYQMSEKLARVS